MSSNGPLSTGSRLLDFTIDVISVPASPIAALAIGFPIGFGDPNGYDKPNMTTLRDRAEWESRLGNSIRAPLIYSTGSIAYWAGRALGTGARKIGIY